MTANKETTKKEKVSPFDFLNSINSGKGGMITDNESERHYNPFMVNRGLSYFPDTIMYANEMNKLYELGYKLQYDYLINTIRARARRSKWVKRKEDSDLDAVMEYYGYNITNAEAALSIISPDDLTIIKKRLEKGGVQ